jgi:hypothetical protein
MKTKICGICKHTLDITEFWTRKLKSGTITRQYSCIKCSKKRRTKYYNTHKLSEKKVRKLREDKIIKWYTDYKATLQCEICGYNKCINALEFHHIDSNTKFKSVSQLFRDRAKIDIIENEIKKCKILCSNCHRELHYNEMHP